MKPMFQPSDELHGSEEIVGPGGLFPIGPAAEAAANHSAGALFLAPMCESPIEIELGAYVLREIEDRGIRLAAQYNWLSFRMDFALLREYLPLLFIECDGKEFHSTPDQIANDRRKDAAAAAARIPLLRFSGSDIFRRGEACAQLAVAEALRQ